MSGHIGFGKSTSYLCIFLQEAGIAVLTSNDHLLCAEDPTIQHFFDVECTVSHPLLVDDRRVPVSGIVASVQVIVIIDNVLDVP